MNDLKASEPIVEINQALNGIEGQELMSLSHFMIDTRIEIMKELTRKKQKTHFILEELREFSDEYIENKYNKPVLASNNGPNSDERPLTIREEKALNRDFVSLNFLQEIKASEIPELLDDLKQIRGLLS